MKLYAARTYFRFPIYEIEIEVLKETPHYFVTHSKKIKKISEFVSYFKSYDEAKNYLILMQNQKIKQIEASLKIAQNQLQRLNEL
jgi:hypothetical protein